MIDIEEIVELNNKSEEFLEFYNDNRNLPVILYGAGAALFWYTDFMKKYDIPIECIVDGKIPVEQIKYIENIAVKNISEVFKIYKDAIVVISAPRYRKEIERNIKKQRLLYNVFSFDPTLEIQQGISNKGRRDFLKTQKDEIRNLWNTLEDDFSKRTLEHVIKGSVTSDCDCYSDIASDSQYFPDIVKVNVLQNRKGGGICRYRCIYGRYCLRVFRGSKG